MDSLAGEPWLRCPNCGYDLRGLPENRCPECGGFFDPEKLRLRFEQGVKEKLPKIATQTFSFALVLPVMIFCLNYFVGLVAILCFSMFPHPGIIPQKAISLSLLSEWIIGPAIILCFYRYRLRKNGIPLLNWVTITFVLLLAGEACFVIIFVYKLFG